MAAIFRVKNKYGYSYKVLIRNKGLKDVIVILFKISCFEGLNKPMNVYNKNLMLLSPEFR